MSDGKRLGLEKGKDFAKGRDVRGRSAGSKRKVVNITKMHGDEYILITVIGGDRETASKVRGSPLGTMDWRHGYSLRWDGQVGKIDGRKAKE